MLIGKLSDLVKVLLLSLVLTNKPQEEKRKTLLSHAIQHGRVAVYALIIEGVAPAFF